MTPKGDILIRARNLSKVYKLYTSPRQRVLDLLGIVKVKPGTLPERRALDGIDLEIQKGEKVAFIGRNGAGKSTLLKIMTRVVEPSGGELEIHGKAFALLQIGTGFHPDFTGRQNVMAYLAQMGVVGDEANRLLADIVDFSELEEYIDQPVKTYSTGMGARLMFATSTVVAPDLLVLDEILGVGDAYFAHKSFSRIKEMCDRAGTTVLLVSHDVYSASKLCERMIWIERGRIVLDSDAPTVIRAYEDSIREQEEHRLRLKKAERLKDLSVKRHLQIELQAAENRPQPSPLHVGRMIVKHAGRPIATIPLGPNAFADADGPHLVADVGCWGETTNFRGRSGREIRNFGSPFHKAGAALPVDENVALEQVTVEVAFASEQPVDFRVQAYLEDQELYLGTLPPSNGNWIEHEARPTVERMSKTINASGIVGTAAIHVRNVQMLDERGNAGFVHQHGETVSLQIDYEIRQPRLRERAEVLVAFHRDGVQDVCRIITRDLLFDESRQRQGTIQLRLPYLHLACGKYTVTVMVAREGYYSDAAAAFYSINTGVYACLVKLFEIQVVGGGAVAAGTTCVVEGDWELLPDANQRELRHAS